MELDNSVESMPFVSIVIPCYNEEAAIGKVIDDFKRFIPNASIYVYDNNSTDETAQISVSHGAIVRHESRQGKGNVVRRMFRDIQADFYVLVDGDGTYDASLVTKMLKMAVDEKLDLVNCVRKEVSQQSYRSGHMLGNKVLTKTVNVIFGNYIQDMLSGYKVLSRRFVKSFPIQSNGFDIETEIAIHALQLRCPMGHIEGNYYERCEGSKSKLKTFKDGFKILKLILSLFRHEKPLYFFSIIGVVLVLISLFLGIPVVLHFFKTGLVPKLPTALLSVSIMIIAFLNFVVGIITDATTKGRIESKMIAYLSIPAFESKTPEKRELNV